MRTVTFKIEPQLLELLDLYSMNHNMARSEVIRLAIERLIREELLAEDAKIKATVERGKHL